MKEIKRTYQHRRDFRADYKCQGCGHIEKDISGYDDIYFHTIVIPDMKCKECEESTNTLGEIIEDKTIVPAGVVI